MYAFRAMFLFIFSFIWASSPAEVQYSPQPLTKTPIVSQKKPVIKKDEFGYWVMPNPLGITFYYPNYILPFYYVKSPDQAVYEGNTPDNQRIKNEEVKFQISFAIPIWHDMFRVHRHGVSLYASYTQLSYWQLYAKSQYFRETDYEPQIFFCIPWQDGLMRLGLDHQSNGRGGALERSWNRAFFTLNVTPGSWLFSIEPWILVFKSHSSDRYNPDIAKYLGHEQVVIAYRWNNKVELSLLVRNIERLRHYMTEQAALSIPFTKHLQLYFQLFHGYGQSLIEYRHKTTSVGVGISLSNWL